MTSPYSRPHGVVVCGGRDPLWGPEDPHLYVAHLPSGPLVVLDGSAAVVWHAATLDRGELFASPGDLVAEVAASVAEMVGLEVDDVRSGVADLLADLVGRGLLVPWRERRR